MRAPANRMSALMVVVALAAAPIFAASLAAADDLGGTHLSWWACPGDQHAAPGVPFDCVPDGGSVYTLIGSIGLSEDITNVLSMDADVLIAFPEAKGVPAFWQLEPNGCNPSALSLIKGMPEHCGDHVNAFCRGDSDQCDLFYSPRIVPGVNVLKLSITAGRIYPNTVQLSAGQRYFAFALNIPMIGAADCSGCSAPAAIGFSRATLYSFDANGEPRPPVTVSGSFPGSTACATANDGYSECARVPARRMTWGQLKSLYR